MSRKTLGGTSAHRRTWGEFRVADGSPALKIGFMNFPMDQFGVKNPSLKAIAATPVILELDVRSEIEKPRYDRPKPLNVTASYWCGSKVQSLRGEEFSAFGVTKEGGGVTLLQVTQESDAAKAGLTNGDLIQRINGIPIITVSYLFAAECSAGDTPLKLTVVRNQQPQSITLAAAPYVLLETAENASGFSTLILSGSPSGKVSANLQSKDDPVETLLDVGYGPVFANGVTGGMYRMDLGESKAVSAITSWSTNRGGVRGPQKFTLYGSNSDRDPGWEIGDPPKFRPLGTIDITSQRAKKFTATSLRARNGQSLGTFRWILWHIQPVTSQGENTSFQELRVE